MQLYTAIISKDTTNIPSKYSLKDYVKVRIPHFHGTKTNYPYTLLETDVAENIASEEELPLAIINRTLDNKTFSAEDFNDGDLVYVALENNNANKPIIMGFASRFSYTEDPDTASANASGANDDSVGTGSDHSSFAGAGSVVEIAQRCLGMTKETFLNYFNIGLNTAWCAVFVRYCFARAGYTDLLPNTASSNGIYDYFYANDKTKIITSGFKKGDVLLTGNRATAHGGDNWNGIEHTCLAEEDEASDGSVKTINGNWGGQVKRDTHKKSQICYGIAFGDLVNQNTSGDTETQIYNTAINWGLNNAAACAILANINAESSFNVTEETNDTDGTSTFKSYGLCQWNRTRLSDLKTYCNKNNLIYSSVSGQLAYLKYELENSYPSTWNYLRNVANTSTGAYNAAIYWAENFEACASQYVSSRGESARDTYWPQYSTKKNNDLASIFTSHGETLDTSCDIVLVANSSGGNLDVYTKSSGTNLYSKVSSYDARFGYNGVTTAAKKKEGDGKTPTGAYSLGAAFGNSANPGTTYHYKDVTQYSYWVSDPDSTKYNQWVEYSGGTKDWATNKAEHLADYPTQYAYAFVINYNIPAQGTAKGSAIFLHVNGNNKTAGCISIPKNNMIELMKKFKSTSSCQILIF